MRRFFPLTLLIVSNLAWAAPANRCAEFEKAVASGSAAKKFKSFLDAQWKYWMTEFPEWATYVGYPGQDDRLSDDSLAAVERHRKETVCQQKALKKISRTALSPKDRVDYDLALYNGEIYVEAQKYPDELMPINHLDGIQIEVADLFSAMPKDSVDAYENILKRLAAVPLSIAQQQERMREGLRLKVTPVRAFLGKVVGQIDVLLAAKVENSPIYEPFNEMPKAISEAEQARLRRQAVEVIQTKVYPAFRQLKEFMLKEYIPQSREFTAFGDMPNGKAWYGFLVRQTTTTEMSPDQLHSLGLKEVERITAEMKVLAAKTGFKGELKDFNKMLLSDKRFFYSKPEDLLIGYRDIAKRMDAELPKLFRTLPRMTYGVRAMPDYQAKSGPAARYSPGSPDSGRGAFFEANTFDLPSRPKWEMETLTFHEAVPGHHLQIAIAQELADTPNFRKHGGFTAFQEGWALYAESLGDELGFFKDPYSKYGNLAAEMIRAVRLVVDTGLHTKGWSKARALEYYRSKMPVSDIDSENEIDRYITWPSQALAYKVGQLKFRQLRELAQKTLGPRFNVRDFHDEVLRHGALPLDVLEQNVHEWMQKKVSEGNS